MPLPFVNREFWFIAPEILLATWGGTEYQWGSVQIIGLALLCALAAEACLHADDLPDGTVGLAPVVDEGERVLREGFIVSPGAPGSTPEPSAPAAPAA